MNKANKTRKGSHSQIFQEAKKAQVQQILSMLVLEMAKDARRLQYEDKIHAEEACEGEFDSVYNLEDAEKIVDTLANKYTSDPDNVKKIALTEIGALRRAQPSFRINLKSLLLLLLTAWIPLSQAKVTEFSSQPGEQSLYDASSAGLIATGIGSLALAGIFPPLALVGVGLTYCGVASRSAGSVHRLYNHYTGEHPLERSDLFTETMDVFVPGSGIVTRGIGSKMIGVLHSNRVDPTWGVNATPYLVIPIKGVYTRVTNAFTRVSGFPISNENKKQHEVYIQGAAEAVQSSLESVTEHAPIVGTARILKPLTNRIAAAANAKANQLVAKIVNKVTGTSSTQP